MRTTKFITTLTAAAAAAALLAGCGNDTTNTTGTIGNSPVAGAGATTASNADPKQQATDQALNTTKRYYETLSRVDADVTVPVGAIDEVAAGPALTTSKADVTVRRSQGITITGTIKLVDSEAKEVRLDPKPAMVKVRACVDVSSRDAKFPDGRSALGQSNVKKISQTLTLENAQWPDAAGWRVVGNSALENRTQEPCDA